MPKLGRNRLRYAGGPHSSRSPQKLETLGLIIILILILAVAVTRSWHHIPWSAR